MNGWDGGGGEWVGQVGHEHGVGFGADGGNVALYEGGISRVRRWVGEEVEDLC